MHIEAVSERKEWTSASCTSKQTRAALEIGLIALSVMTMTGVFFFDAIETTLAVSVE